MSLATLSLEQHVAIITQAIEQQYREALYARLSEIAKEVAEQAARDTVKRVESYRNVAWDRTEVQVLFNLPPAK
ncbi:hypothetical protein [Achromobacter sp. NFACC18-2]|uniref:hypothetical protein n=1 Tax=Achromobacter sp. NFACC18-2 TaxID=1564112 RepID=UPI0008D5BAE8|nr:hypothetical protein [Achromobacter sp. NFACC18-2]SEJ84965.1 hypothetical protein SAMN03159494_03567 [Achromobacter sp. NFACC18-2]